MGNTQHGIWLGGCQGPGWLWGRTPQIQGCSGVGNSTEGFGGPGDPGQDDGAGGGPEQDILVLGDVGGGILGAAGWDYEIPVCHGGVWNRTLKVAWEGL